MIVPPSRPLPRRDWLKAGGLALAGLALAGRSVRAQAPGSPTTLARLALNENPFGPSPLVEEALRADLTDLHSYTTEADAAALVRQIAEFEGVAPSQVVLGEILEGLGLRLGQRSGPGSEYLYSVPGYPALVNAAAAVGGKVVAQPLDAALGNDLPAIAAAVNARTAAIFLVNPHNPTGTVSDKAAFHAFLTDVSRRTLVIVDEAYLEYTDDYAGRTAVSHLQAGENVLVFRTMAKVYGLGALPMGYALAPAPLAEALRAAGLGFFRDQNRLALRATGAALRDQALVRRTRDVVAAERTLWHRDLDGLGLKRTDSQANFVYFDVGRPHAAAAAAFAAEGIEVARAFPPYATWVRISIGQPAENARARAALRRFLGATPA